MVGQLLISPSATTSIRPSVDKQKSPISASRENKSSWSVSTLQRTALYESLESILGAGSLYQIRAPALVPTFFVSAEVKYLIMSVRSVSLSFDEEDEEKGKRRAQRDKYITLLER